MVTYWTMRGVGSSLGAAAAVTWVPRHARQQRQRRVAYCQQQKGNGSGGEKDRKKGNGGGGEKESIQNFEVLIGDCLCLLCFALYKQITALIFLPSFPGWLAPLAFNPVRFLEFFSFAVTLIGTWVASGMLTGGYRFAATADVQAALRRTCFMWLISMPVAAAQLVLLTAAEGEALVGDEGFASKLPLAATGAGEPFVTAAGVLGLMLVWRTFYASYLDMYSFRSSTAARRDRGRDMEEFADSLRSAMLLSLACCAVLQFLGGLVGEEQLEMMAAGLLAHASLTGGAP
ncbi:hypothetical protein CHLNCDRAFT_52364 [Chlorella variabilis]|uniref:Uncharacterized protein n=1 Tax=Chlorella variabilis TaxID=554065 RepID=E1ZES6_CHLVA|nr:hypothetical protein CHLNCDRAFT_52364 [Chlorella variabilis]EFN55548.1 hypothetical protein CHLNCDRAFT_52364 [Chlorella variabilis]|eukprot:XP_005847650.1 hypothetical protein CHLNCDRAFT_52364 [Chlorella variabilis]